MDFRPFLMVVLFCFFATFGGAQVLLDADFDASPTDVPIGTGGAIDGEPMYVGSQITAIVRSSPMATPSLEIQDVSQIAGGYARFEFLDNEEVETGWLRVSFDAWLPDVENDLSVGCREAGSSVYIYSDISFGDDGYVWGSDNAGGTGALVTYPLGKALPIVMILDMDGRTWDLYVDGSLVLDHRAHGIASGGLGSVLVGTSFDGDVFGAGYVDDLLVEKIMFFDGFETGDASAWSNP